MVDDGSTDLTPALVRAKFPQTILLKGDGNLWWTGATNVGIRYALQNSISPSKDFVLMLNNDLTVEPDYVQSLLAVYEQYHPCLIGSVSLDQAQPDRVDWAGVRWNPYTAKFRYLAKKPGLSYQRLASEQSVLATDLLTGRGMLVPLIAFHQVGLPDAKRFPQYAADGDFSYRASQYGYKLLVSLPSKVFSHVTETGLGFQYNRPSYSLFFQSLKSIKSPTNLRVRYYWAMKNSKLKIGYFLLDFLRIVASFHIRYFKFMGYRQSQLS